MTDTSPDQHNPLCVNTKPSDEELFSVMCGARSLALSRKQVSDEWIKTTLAELVAATRAKDNAQVTRECNANNVQFHEDALEISVQRDNAIESNKLDVINHTEFLKFIGITR